MTANGWSQILLFFAIIFAITKPIGLFMARVFSGERTFMDPVLKPVERVLYRMTRATLWVLVPACVLYAVVLIAQGVPQNLRPYDTAKLVESQTIQSTDASGKPTTKVTTEQTIAQGPVASQEAIKMLGTNGGGFFNVNSAHPFENPTPFSNFLQMISIFAIPAGLTYTLGKMTGSQHHGWAVWAAMAVLFVAGGAPPELA